MFLRVGVPDRCRIPDPQDRWNPLHHTLIIFSWPMVGQAPYATCCYTRPFFPSCCNQDSTQLIVFDTRDVGKIWLGLARATKKKPSRKRKASLEKNADTLRCSISTTLFCKSVNTFTKTYSSTTTIKMHPPSNARKCNKMTFNMRDASHAEQFMSKFFKLHFKFSSIITQLS